MAFFSVIIPTFNRLSLLEEALTSVWRQTFSDYEVIVVDDGSSDGTGNYLKSLNARVKVLTQTNCGPSAARNLGLREACSEYVAFLDSDDVWFPWTLETFHRALSIHSSPTHLLGNAITFSNSLTDYPTPHRGVDRFESYPDFLRSVERSIIWSSGNAVVRRVPFAERVLFEAELRCFEDQDIGLQLGCEPGFVYVRSPCTLGVRTTQHSLTRSITRDHFMGLQTLIGKERLGRYPGGTERKQERRTYICLSIRSLSIALAKNEEHRDAWTLYVEGLSWNLSLVRLRYAIGFPLLLTAYLVKHIFANPSESAVTRQRLL